MAHTPVPGYREQSAEALATVKQNKEAEEIALRLLDSMKDNPDIDQRWLAIGRTHLEQAWMAINRAVMKPQRIQLAWDDKGAKNNDD